MSTIHDSHERKRRRITMNGIFYATISSASFGFSPLFSIGLLTAARKFDYTLEYRFSTYATKWIRQGVTRCLMNHGCMIRVPMHTAERIRKITSVRNRLLQENGTEPDIQQLAQHCDLPVEKVRRLLQRHGLERSSEQVIDATSVKETKSLLILDDGRVAISSMTEAMAMPAHNQK